MADETDARTSASAAAGGTADQDDAAALRTELERTREELAEARADAVSLRAALEASRSEVGMLYASLSWRATRPLRTIWDFASGLPSFLHEMRDFPRRARYTLATRGGAALRADVASELANRLRRGTLATPGPARPALGTSPPIRGANGKLLPVRLPRHEAPRVSIVVPVFNEFESTYACLASIVERGGGLSYEVIVADDGSSDETREIEQLVPGLHVVRGESNRGFIDACNRGAAAASGEYLVFLNNDTILTPHWLERLIEPFEDPRVGLVGAKLVYPDGRLQEAGGILFSDGSGWNYGRGDDPARPKYEFQCEAHYCSGACIAISRALFEELGGFDTGFAPMYYEDVDLALAVRAAGRKVVYQPAAVVVHFEGASAGTDTTRGAKRYQAVNRSKLVEKWAESLPAQPAPESNPDVARYRPVGPHVLVIDSYTPRPDHDAGSLRMANLLRILRDLGCHVSFMPENRAHDGDYTLALQSAGIEALYHPYLPSLEQHLEEFGARYDTVIMSRVDVAEHVLDAVRRHCPKARRVFDTVDLHFLRESRGASLGEQGDGSRAERTKARELAVARACDVTLVVSAAEREILAREAPDVTVELMSLVHESTPAATPFSERSGILFIGNFQHPPNIDAVEYYLREIQPLLHERLAGVRFTAIGANVPPGLERLAGPDVRLTGHVRDIEPYFAAARLSIAPLRYGAGIKGKITTSMAFGLPVVTTALGAEGMGLEHGKHALIADSPDAFADAVVALHSDEAVWNRLSANGPPHVSAQFSFDKAEAMLSKVLGLSNSVAGVG